MSGRDRTGERRFIHSGSRWEEMAGYARAVVDGEWIFVSGTVGQDFATGEFPPTALQQCERALDTIEAALAQARAGLADVLRVRVYLVDRADVAAVSEVLCRRFAGHTPANTTVCCALAVEQALVELEVTARRRAPLP